MREALCYLPVAKRGASYAQVLVEGGYLRFDLRKALMDIAVRMESCRSLGVKPFLDKDHDYLTQMFIAEKACLIEAQGVFVLGCWTREGLKLRSEFRGISHSCVEYSIKYPPPKEYLAAKKKQVEEMAKIVADDADFHAAIGCVCIDKPPTFPGTIKRLSLDGAANDLEHLMYAFNSTKISWPLPTSLK
jgi:hypothetical protein